MTINMKHQPPPERREAIAHAGLASCKRMALTAGEVSERAASFMRGLRDHLLHVDVNIDELAPIDARQLASAVPEKEWREHYDIPEDAVALNALPDADKIAHLLIEIIDQPERRKKLGQQAREFVEQHHHYREISQRYLKTRGC